MAREIRLVITCDGEPGTPCDHEVEPDTAPVTFTYEGVPYVRDLCFLHRAEFVGLMKAMVEVSTPESQVPGVVAARPVRGKAPRKYAQRRPAPKATCPECQVTIAAHTLRKHVLGQHSSGPGAWTNLHNMSEVDAIVDEAKRSDEAARRAETLARTEGARNGKA